MLDIKRIREAPEAVKERLARRDASSPSLIDRLLELDRSVRNSETELQNLQAERNRLSKEIGKIRSQGGDATEIQNQVKSFSERMAALSAQSSTEETERHALLLRIANLPQEETPVGATPEDNPTLRTWGEPKRGEHPDHLAIANQLGLLDLERAAKISGSGFACFTGAGARLERALINFLLDLHTGPNGYREIAPPLLIREASMVGTGQLPKFEEDMYGLKDDPLFLAPTAEVPVTNLYREEILAEEELPLKLAAFTPCFRREAGATGRETRGIIRLHQFGKVELVRICRPEESAAHHEQLTAEVEKVLQLLELPYRVIDLCTGDLGFSAARTYDLEVWSPGQQDWLEVSSCSNFEDYQARRMNLRFKPKGGKNQFCHTLNGSGTALPRLYVALLETHLQPDGTVRLPEPLHPYFGGDCIG